MKKIILTILILVVCFSQSFAFDDNRKGFSFSSYFGFTPYASWNSGIRSKNFQSAHLSILFGYNIDRQNLISLDLKMPRFSPVMDEAVDFDSTLSYNSYKIGYIGSNWMHFGKIKSTSVYSEIGIGWIRTKFAFDEGDKLATISDGFAIVLGSGLQLSNKFYCGLTYMRGQTEYLNYNISHNVVFISITFISN